MSFNHGNSNQIGEQRLDPQACRALWCAVIEEQLRLALSSSFYDLRYQVDGARQWFGSRDFHMVCSLAGLDGERVLMGVQRVLIARVAA